MGPLLDSLLDATVVAGFTRIGYRLRSRGWAENAMPRMDGKTVLLSSGSSGIGLAATEGFARLGATVWLPVRHRVRGEEARQRIGKESGSADVHIGLCDLSDLASVRAFAQYFAQRAPRLDVLVNNAGLLGRRRAASVDGIELTFATNVIGPFLLTAMLIPMLQASVPSRIVNVSSGGMYTQRIRVDDLQSDRGRFDGAAAYARTKRAQVILTELWAQRLEGSGVVVHAMHPGWVDTPGLRTSLPRFHELTRHLLRTPEEGADTILWLGTASDPGRSTGGFWHDWRRRATHVLPWTRELPHERERLWERCVALSRAGIQPARAA